MKKFTAQDIANLLKEEDPSMSLRKVRYYTQLSLIPPLELLGNKRVYTEKHLHYIRAVLTLSKLGKSLAAIKEEFQTLSFVDVEGLSNQFTFYNNQEFLQHKTYQVSEDIAVSLSPNVSGELKQQVLYSLSQITKGNQF